jgi:HEPN domain-containing protein
VTNKEAAQKLLQAASRLLERDLQAAWEDADYNLVVRRAQEVVELVLKGALRFLGADYPKVHDVGAIFAHKIREKMPEVEGESLERIRTISTWLAGARAPAFYWEQDYKAEEARQAREDATFVFTTVMKWLGGGPMDEG